MTPPRLFELRCPSCHGTTWTITSDQRGITPDILVAGREHGCSGCRYDGTSWTLVQASPHGFFMQPRVMHPITQAEFEYWTDILRRHFPEHHLIPKIGRSFRPFLPEDHAAKQAEHASRHPVCEMRDQDNARRVDPSRATAAEWLDIMVAGDTLQFLRRDGGALHLLRSEVSVSARCVDAAGAILAERTDMAMTTAHTLVGLYVSGDEWLCAQTLRLSAASGERRR